MPGLVLGPLLRHVDETSATVWVETDAPCAVRIATEADSGSPGPEGPTGAEGPPGAEASTASARTFTAHGHHYALVDVTGLVPGSAPAYTVELDGVPVWPEPGSAFPPSRLRTQPRTGSTLRLMFGSCRMSAEHDAAHHARHGVDTLRALGARLAADESDATAKHRGRGSTRAEWPDLIVLLGDQVYADEASPPLRRYLDGRRAPGEEPVHEIADFEEYTHLYLLAWSDPTTRWLLSTVSTAMIFDDHDVRDDWNTSQAWREQMERLPWWRDRIVGGLASYWIYQHLGNISPVERRADPTYQAVTRTGFDTDVGTTIDALAEQADTDPTSYRWSYCRELDGVRLLMLDTRAGRLLDPERRRMVDDAEMVWFGQRARGDVDHLLIGSSLPFLLPRGLHELEAWNEAVCRGAWGRRGVRWGERVRQAVDLEHWAAFGASFEELAGVLGAVASGERGRPPATVTVLSGDVHHSYLSRARLTGARSAIYQAVCSPIRNPLPRVVQVGARLAATGLGSLVGRAIRRTARVPGPSFRWKPVAGPWFSNALATLELDGRSALLRWDGARAGEGGELVIEEIATVHLG